MSSQNFQHYFKLILIGDAGVGKTSMLLQKTDGINNTFFNNLNK